MKLLEERIKKDGKALGKTVLKVDSFINHQVDSEFMDALGIEVSSLGVASLYESFLDTIVIDKKDNNLKDDLEKIVSEVIVTNTIMKNLDDKKKLAKIILNDIS